MSVLAERRLSFTAAVILAIAALMLGPWPGTASEQRFPDVVAVRLHLKGSDRFGRTLGCPMLTGEQQRAGYKGLERTIRIGNALPYRLVRNPRRFHMTMDPSFIQLNRASSNRIRTLVSRLNDQEMLKPVVKNWTVAITLAHLAFWDRRVMHVLEVTEQAGKLVAPEIDLAVNDFSLPLWAAIPPRDAARIAVEAAENLNVRLENFPAALLEEIYNYNNRWVVRAMHRNEHLDEVDAALKH
jgi:hypothetical protein